MENDLRDSVRRFHDRFALTRDNQSKTLWLCMLMEEVGELTRSTLKDDSVEAIEGECGDIIYVLQGFCELFGYDLWAGVERTMTKNDRKTRQDTTESKVGKIVSRPSKLE